MVRVGDDSFPVKQALAAPTGLKRSAFISTVAQTKLTALGFDVYETAQIADDNEQCRRGEELSEVEVLVDAVQEIPIGVLGSEYGYPNLVLCLVDAIFSIGIRYTTTRRVVGRFSSWWNANERQPSATSDRLTLSDLVAVLPPDQARTEANARDIAKTVFGNLNRTSSRNGILKAAAVLEAAEACLAYRIDTVEDIVAHRSDEQFVAAFRSVPGQGSGISLRYLFMLAGVEDEAKPDRMIMRFIERHLGYQPSPDRAVSLLHDVAAQLVTDGIDMSVRRLDHAIWRHESDSVQPSPGKAIAMDAKPTRSKYKPLGDYLAGQSSDRVELTFGEIETIIGAQLPASALRHSAFWANHYGGTHVWAMQWMDAGWKVASHSLTGQRVVFVRA